MTKICKSRSSASLIHCLGISRMLIRFHIIFIFIYRNVKTSTIQVFGKLIAKTTVKEVRELS